MVWIFVIAGVLIVSYLLVGAWIGLTSQAMEAVVSMGGTFDVKRFFVDVIAWPRFIRWVK